MDVDLIYDVISQDSTDPNIFSKFFIIAYVLIESL